MLGRRFFASFIRPIAPTPKQFIHVGNVADNPGALKKKKRVGRGERSGKGKTAGRGQKGWHARASKSRPVPGFEGGQSGILSAIPQIGSVRNPLFQYKHVALDTIQFWINRGRLDADKPITLLELVRAGKLKGIKNGIYLSDYGAQFLTSKIDIKVQETCPGAIEAVEAKGGSIEKVYLGKRDIKALLKPELFAILPKENQLPKDWKDLRRYIVPETRGYLAPKEGESLADVVERVVKGTRPIQTRPRGKINFESTAKE